MRKLFEKANRERGASLVEYSVALALIVIVSIPAMGTANSATTEALNNSVAHFAYDGGGSGSTTTTVPSSTTTTTSTTPTTVPPTTTTVPPTTTTSTTSTTTTTVPPTTTTTTLPVANQTKKATYLNEISVTFEETDGEVTFGSVEADGWTYKVTKDKERRKHLKFTHSKTKKVVVIKGWLNKNDKLKTKVQEKN